MRLSPSALALLAAALFSSAPAARADERPDAPRLGARLGLLAPSVAFEGGRWGEPLLDVALEASGRRGLFAFDAFAHSGLALRDTGMGSAHSFGVRAGVRLERFTILAGPLFIFAPGSPSVDKLPSITMWAGPERWRVVFGLFDRHGTVPARLGVETQRFGVAILPLYGVEGWGRMPLRPGFSADARVSAYQLFGHGTLQATVGVAWTPWEAR